MKKIILTFVCMTCSFLASAQDSDSTKIITTPSGAKERVILWDQQVPIVTSEDAKRLKDKLIELDARIFALEVTTDGNQRSIYEKNYSNFHNFVNLVNELDLTFDDINKDRLKAEAYNILSDVNNPENNSLGFKFSDIVQQKAMAVISNEQNLTGSDKKLFGIKIINLISSIGSMVTPVGLINSAISFMTSFTSEKMSKSLLDPIDKNDLSKFKDSLSIYRTYYASIDLNSSTFITNLTSLDIKYAQLKNNIENFKLRIGKECKIDFASPPVPQVNSLFSQPGHVTVNHGEINRKTEILYMATHIKELQDNVSSLSNYYTDYNSIVVTNFNNNLMLLKNAKNLPKSDSAAIDVLITKLTELRDGKVTGTETTSGFKTQFSGRIVKMTNFLSAMK